MPFATARLLQYYFCDIVLSVETGTILTITYVRVTVCPSPVSQGLLFILPTQRDTATLGICLTTARTKDDGDLQINKQGPDYPNTVTAHF